MLQLELELQHHTGERGGGVKDLEERERERGVKDLEES